MSMSESAIQQRVLLEASNRGVTLWRNNVGACRTDDGRVIRYGLANESERMNKHIKSSDLIGITPTIIVPEHVGMVLGIFTAIECKRQDWRYSEADERTQAQRRFIDFVHNNGGFAGFCNDPAMLTWIIKP